MSTLEGNWQLCIGTFRGLEIDCEYYFVVEHRGYCGHTPGQVPADCGLAEDGWFATSPRHIKMRTGLVQCKRQFMQLASEYLTHARLFESRADFPEREERLNNMLENFIESQYSIRRPGLLTRLRMLVLPSVEDIEEREARKEVTP